MKFNKQKIEDIKNKIRNIQEKVASQQKEKVPKKYYALMILMLLLGVITLSNNMKDYNNSAHEDFKEYELEEKEANADEVQVVNYIMDQSSISTNVSSMDDDKAVETISTNSETEYIMPIVGEIIKEFAVEKLVYSETLGMWKTHPGIDIKCEVETAVKSASEGVVQSIEQDSFYGNTVKILDGNGYIFVYSNLDKDILVVKGDKVSKGDKIGTVGVSASGELADESHLHFEVIKDGTQINPQDLIN